MLILAIKTDKPEAELCLYNGQAKLGEVKWQAHRQLAETIHEKILEVLKAQNKNWHDIEALVCFKGPGSFTGLRIGMTVANTLASSLEIPVVSTAGENWISTGIKRVEKGENEEVALPEYGAPVHITKPRK